MFCGIETFLVFFWCIEKFEISNNTLSGPTVWFADLLCTNNWPTTTYLNDPQNCWGFGLSLCPPFPLIIKTKFPKMVLIEPVCEEVLESIIYANSSHMASKLFIDICQPTKHSTIVFSTVFSFDRNLRQLLRNGICPLFSLSAFLCLWLLLNLALLNALNNWLRCLYKLCSCTSIIW